MHALAGSIERGLSNMGSQGSGIMFCVCDVTTIRYKQTGGNDRKANKYYEGDDGDASGRDEVSEGGARSNKCCAVGIPAKERVK